MKLSSENAFAFFSMSLREVCPSLYLLDCSKKSFAFEKSARHSAASLPNGLAPSRDLLRSVFPPVAAEAATSTMAPTRFFTVTGIWKSVLPKMFRIWVRGLPSIARYRRVSYLARKVPGTFCAAFSTIFSVAFCRSSGVSASRKSFTSASSSSTAVPYFSFRSEIAFCTDISCPSGDSFLNMLCACMACAAVVLLRV